MKVRSARALALGSSVALTLLAAAPAWSLPTNGSFESGGAGWSAAGDAALVAGPVLGFSPTDGANQVILTTVTNASDPFAPFSGVDASSAVAIEALLSLAAGSIQSAGGAPGREGSVVYQTFTATPGELLRVDWVMLSMEPSGGGAPPQNDDFVFLSLGATSSGSPGSVTTLTMTPTSNPAIYSGGFQTASLVLPAGGTYTLAVGVFDVGDDTDPSAVLVDNVRVIPNPEPGTALLVGLGLVGLAAHGRRRR